MSQPKPSLSKGQSGCGGLDGLPARVTLRRLNDETAPDWSEPQALEGLSTLELGAFETVRVDV